MASSSEPKLAELVEALHEAATKWQPLGLQLGLPLPVLKAIDYQNTGNCGQALADMASEWLNQGEDVTWAAVVKALRTRCVGERALAHEIEAQYCPGRSGVTSDGRESTAMRLTKDASLPFLQCLPQPSKSDNISIIQRAAPEYNMLGILLLDDGDGSKIRSIEMTQHHQTEAVMREVFREWIATSQNHSWKKLIDSLRVLNLRTLAKEIEDALKENNVPI